MAALREAEYRVFFENISLDKIKNAICDIIASKEIFAEKISKGASKEIDIRSMIIMLETTSDCLMMRLAAGPAGSLKSGLVIDEIKKRAGDFKCRTVRTGLYTHIDGKAIDLLTAYQG